MRPGSFKYFVLIACCSYAHTSIASFTQGNDSNGIVSIEAEHFTANHGGLTDDWFFTQSFADYSGSGAMVVGPDGNAQNNSKSEVYTVESPRLDYEIDFQKTGIHHVWVRGISPNSSTRSDSVHVGLNGVPVSTQAGNGFGNFTDNEFNWYIILYNNK